VLEIFQFRIINIYSLYIKVARDENSLVERSENSTPDFDVMKVELSLLSESMRSTNSDSMRSTNSDYTITTSYPSMTSNDESTPDGNSYYSKICKVDSKVASPSLVFFNRCLLDINSIVETISSLFCDILEITSTRDLHSTSQRGAATATSIYVSTCKMLNIPVSKSLYRSLTLSTINLKYHTLSELQVKAFAVGLTVSY